MTGRSNNARGGILGRVAALGGELNRLTVGCGVTFALVVTSSVLDSLSDVRSSSDELSVEGAREEVVDAGVVVIVEPLGSQYDPQYPTGPAIACIAENCNPLSPPFAPLTNHSVSETAPNPQLLSMKLGRGS